jgi:thioester reductase-like protein
MKEMLFFTGFPGFLGSELIRELLTKHANQRVICLVQSKFLALAENQRKQFNSLISGRIDFVMGDLTLPNLGLSEEFIRTQSGEIKQIFHLAAVYDLNVSEALAMKVNVEGTKNVLSFARKCASLERLQYVSTCYVSGRTQGVFKETDLIRGQTFNNFYESTKYLAEVEVQKAMNAGMPVTIYRPGVVVGNSKTGETQKFDGPYFVLQWLMRNPKTFAILPTIYTSDCESDQSHLDLVPSDFVIRGIAHLSQMSETRGEVFQLADPKPLRVVEILAEFERVLGKKIISVALPLWLARFALKYIPFVERWMGVPHSSLNYFAHPTSYDITNTLQHLKGSDVEIPRFNQYLPVLVDYMKKNRNIRSKALT